VQHCLVGSEMCIRDSIGDTGKRFTAYPRRNRYMPWLCLG
jgi:hypothetical protein